MPPANTRTDLDARPLSSQGNRQNNRNGGSPSSTSKEDKPPIARILPLTFHALISFHQLSRPLLLLTALSVLPAVRSRVYFTWFGNPIPWKTLSNGLWWSALASWMSGQSLYLLTIAFWWQQGPRRNERGDEA